ncbi:cyclohexanecarboxylate-CoA ligase [Alteribacillus persepolensis]|uniref:Cyclohexanecarboxylate-CoA ligase n=1 Tax=Alteribacillus persepolensis TaxID=568899 RepID=A0A1G8A718_9BACI|nr:class I adenylate-forming enzyme family protein [Alteribacillus persepolensis]SDH16180.1 cyclohexanecarboxylate-CoA ligase [Alteribacillus persepolensis]
MSLNATPETALTIHELITEAASRYQQRPALFDGKNQFTFAELDKLSARVAKHFLKLGLKKGDVIAVQLPNTWEFVIAHLAAARAGLVFNPLSPNYRKNELSYMLGHCETKALITTNQLKGFRHDALAAELKESLPALEHTIITGASEETDHINFYSFMKEDPVGIAEEDMEQNLPSMDDPAVIMFTSGTESNPKAVLHTFQTFVPAHLMNGKEYKVTEEDTILSVTPLCHMFSLPMIIIGMKYGAKQYLYRDYQVDTVIDVLKRDSISFFIAAPAHLIDMIHHLRTIDRADVKMRLILTGGTKIPAQMVKDLRELLDCSVGAQWGMTEVCAGTFTRPDDNPSYAWETVGKATPAGEVIIVNDQYEQVPRGETGEIAFKGECLFKEYYKNEAATKEAFSESGYFLTGDQGWLDEKGYLHFVGRTKDTINRGGLKYHASEVEEALNMHPNIQQSAVVSVPDPRLGERGCAYVSLRENKSFDLEEMKQYLLEKGFAKYKVPEFLEVRESLPATPSGKISKGPLRKEAAHLQPSK